MYNVLYFARIKFRYAIKFMISRDAAMFYNDLYVLW